MRGIERCQEQLSSRFREHSGKSEEYGSNFNLKLIVLASNRELKQDYWIQECLDPVEMR